MRKKPSSTAGKYVKPLQFFNIYILIFEKEKKKREDLLIYSPTLPWNMLLVSQYLYIFVVAISNR